MSTRSRFRVTTLVLLAAGCGSDGYQGTAHDGASGGGAGASGTAGAGTSGAGSYAGGPAAGAAAGRDAGAPEDADVPDPTWLMRPAVPPALEPPFGAAVKLHAHAVGAQIYTCTAVDGGAPADGGANDDAGAMAYAWVLKAPDAKLYDPAGTQVGTHGAGPSWTWRDGSGAVGAKVAELNAPSSDAISWLLLRVKSTSGAGLLTDATYVQRVNTSGGKAPANGCDAATVGTEVRSGYSADYYFLSGGGAATWLTKPDVPSDLAVPTDVKVALHDRGIGFQIYNCTASGSAGAPTYAWVLRSPNVLLSDVSFTPVARLDGGLRWTSTDGSVVVAPEIAQAAAPRAHALPWTLHKEQSTVGPGAFSRIAFIQEIGTSGGVAPSDGCGASTVDTEARVSYSADYYFYVSINEP